MTVSLKTVQIFHSKTTQLCDTSPLVKPACNGQDSKSIHTYKAGFYYLKDEYLWYNEKKLQCSWTGDSYDYIIRASSFVITSKYNDLVVCTQC